MTSSIKKAFGKIFKGKEGESEVLECIFDILRDKKFKNPNFFILPRVNIPDTTGSKEIDLLLLHPVLGIYVIEVKNWKSLKYLLGNKSNPFESIKGKADLLKTFINQNLRVLPINIEYRVVFPSISSKEWEKFLNEHPCYKGYQNHVFFEDDFKNRPERFFNSSSNAVPTKEQFINIVRLLTKKSGEDIVPVLSRDKILFFDYKQLSILNGYTGGFRIIRGVAGTGKTAILVIFALNRPEDNILVLCFNRRLKETIANELKKLNGNNENIHVYSLFGFLRRINFNFSKFGISKENPVEQNYKVFESKDAMDEFRNKLKEYLKSTPINIFLCDETQDMPPGFMRIMLEEIKNCVFFIDEGQKFYPYTMNSIKDVFYHPKFNQTISMRGRVRNLKTVYRTPSNLAKCALEILSLDKDINSYYRKAKYSDNLLSDISCVLEEGRIFIGDFDNFNKILGIVKKFPVGKKTYVLTYTKKIANSINKIFERENISNAKALPLQAVKGLEADNIIIHGFDRFLTKSFENPKEREILYRQIYVLITRARENLFLSIEKSSYPGIEKIPELNNVLQIIKKHSELYNPDSLALSPVAAEKENKTNRKKHYSTLTEGFMQGIHLVRDIGEIVEVVRFAGHLLI